MKQLNTTNKAILVLCWFACLMNAIFFPVLTSFLFKQEVGHILRTLFA